ncbi:MAG: hypothetical protein R6U84_08850 [Candidatus Cloacimonadales bacterium]
MRKLWLIFILFLCTILQAENVQVFGVKSGKLVYELSGSVSGTKTIWFDDYGSLRRTELQSETTVKIFGMANTTTEHNLTIMDGEYLYSVDLQDNSGIKQAMPDLTAELRVAGMSDTDKQDFFDEILANLGGEKLGTEKFLGRTCDLITIMGSKSWIYQGITLKSETSIMGITNNETAIIFEENIKVPADKFVVPANIEWQQTDYVANAFYDELGYDEEYEDDYDEEDYVAPGMVYEKFASVIHSAELSGYNLIRVEDDQDQYLAVFMQSPLNSIMINAIAYDEELLQADSGEIDLQSKFRYRGKDAYFTQTPDGISLLSLILEKEQTMISFIKMSQSTQEYLLKIADKFDF